MKGTRAVLNRIEREGFTFDVLQPPFSTEQMSTFKNISDNWLGSRKEKGFSLGFSLKIIYKERLLQLSKIPKKKLSLLQRSCLLTRTIK